MEWRLDPPRDRGFERERDSHAGQVRESVNPWRVARSPRRKQIWPRRLWRALGRPQRFVFPLALLLPLPTVRSSKRGSPDAYSVSPRPHEGAGARARCVYLSGTGPDGNVRQV